MSGEMNLVEKEVSKAANEIKHANEELHQAERDLERAEAALHRVEEEEKECREVHFFLDGEPEETRQRVLTPDEIIAKFGHKSPATHYLVQIEDGQQKRSFRGKGEEPIRVHEGECFQIIATGPAPLSDVAPRTGVEVFKEGLQVQGYVACSLPGRPDHVYFDYEVRSGKFAQRKVRLGFIVPADFPLTPPGGLHVSPRIHPFNSSQVGAHPTCAIHEVQSKPFEAGAGGQWQYWSRPFPANDWPTSKKTVAVYMSYIWLLWDSQ